VMRSHPKPLCALHPQVVQTIHQPNSDITEKFDDFMLLSGGNVIYFGKWERAVGYFAAHGYQLGPPRVAAVHGALCL
jgi:hypothetical protein